MQNEDPDAFGDSYMTIEEKIRLFAELSGDERREVEQYVESHGDDQPHLRELLQESRRFDGLLDSARALAARPGSEEAVAFFAVMRELDRDRRPDEIARDLDRIETEIERNPELQMLLDRYVARAAELTHATDPQAQFARLVDATKEEPAAVDGLHPESPGAAPVHPNSDDLAGRGRSRRPTVRRLAGAAVSMAALYALLFVLGRWTQPEHERLARFSSDELRLPGYEDVRGPAGDAEPDEGVESIASPTTAHVHALEQLRRAEWSFVGLFPRYSEERLDSASTLLEHVIALEPDDSFLADEARFFLGKTELARGNLTEARTILERVAASPSVRSEDARDLLAELGS